MSNSELPFGEAAFTIYHSGKFSVANDQRMSYVGGDHHTLVCPPRAFFTRLPEVVGFDLYGYRIWYKLPFEDFTELKMMCSGESRDAMFEKMVQGVGWTKMAEVFMEKEDVSDGVAGDGLRAAGDGLGADDCLGAAGDGLRVDGDGLRAVGDGLRAAGDGLGADGDRDAGWHRDADNNGDEMLDEEARVEENVSGFVDEEEHDNSEDTPPNSDCEDGGGRKFQRCKKGSGNLRLGQVFDSIPEFKEAVIDYVLKNGCNLKFTRWGSLKCEVKCAVGDKGKDIGADDNGADDNGNDESKGCPFRIYCSYEKTIKTYLLKTFNDEHTCIPDWYSKVVKGGIIAKLFLNDLRRDPTIKPKAMQEALEEKYNINVSNDQCRKAKKKALMMIQDEHDEQFARIKDYKLELIRSRV